ncbi:MULTISPECIES: TonB-dependent receptor [Methylorubrum]|uniref:TonB-dependent receptor n=1 Tax=Methylorubrum TaxID=2282523 RepID=UPI00209DB6D6|nr:MULTISPECIES: TonB-dependent receptor [Methylorubrum]MCP1550280.1 iron complex outermembrane receptor protein [Methylorubrum zatmanii]MCP1553107.1 iron complex outermembrane receptor protein [Methylorubrum extorquens]MCP1580583.1 iron complex outermembrane receptor protein [Methylorubrum extorquens]
MASAREVDKISIVPIATDIVSASLDAAANRHRVAIPPGPLEPALTALARQMRLKLAYQTTLTEGLVTLGAEGEFRPLEALARILEGTGLTYRSAGPSTITLVNPRYVQLGPAPANAVTLEELSVEGQGRGRAQAAGLPPPTGTMGQPPVPYAGGQVGSGARLGVLGNRNVFDTPFNTAGYTSKLIRDQQAQGLIDVIENDPSVRAVSSLSDAPGTSLFIRGFDVLSLDIGFDGLFGITDVRRPPIYNIERVEVLKGPSALVNAAAPNGGVGGSINLIPKRAYEEPLTRITPFFISQGQLGTAVDIGRRFGPTGEWGVRANGVFQRGETAIDRERLQLGFGSLGVDYRGDRFRMSFDLAYQDTFYQRNRGFIEAFPGIDIPRAPRLSSNLGRPGLYHQVKSVLGATRFEYDLTDDTTLFAGFGAGHTAEDAFASYKSITSSNGEFDDLLVRRVADFTTYTADAGLRTRFVTGPIRHNATLSATGFWAETSFPKAFQFLPGGSANFSNPSSVPATFTDIDIGTRFNGQTYRSVSIADTLSSLDDRVLLTIGGRVQQLAAKGFGFRPGTPSFGQITSSYDNTAFTPAVALVVKPIENLSLYGNYVEALISPNTPLVAANASDVLAPIVADQKEVGIKYDFGTVGASVALFEIHRPSAFLDAVTGVFAANGLQRNRGLEFNLFGEPLPGVRLIGGASFIDGRLVNTAGGAFDGRVAPGVPAFALNLYGEVDLPPWLLPGLTATGRVIHTARQFYDQGNTQNIPDWTRFDAGLRYTFLGSWGKPVTLRANVVNVFGSDYWASTGLGLLTLGTPRTVLLSAQLDF